MNAKEELQEKLETCASVLCAEVVYRERVIALPVDYTRDEYAGFMQALDFDYDDGYGIQELFGTVWLTDGTWLRRDECDGSEWWVHTVCPEVPPYLQDRVK